MNNQKRNMFAVVAVVNVLAVQPKAGTGWHRAGKHIHSAQRQMNNDTFPAN